MTVSAGPTVVATKVAPSPQLASCTSAHLDDVPCNHSPVNSTVDEAVTVVVVVVVSSSSSGGVVLVIGSAHLCLLLFFFLLC